MGTKIGDLANSYHTAFNNQLNAQKAYIDAYITGINARNAVNQEARTKDQYWNYTNPLQASNLGITLGQNNIQQRILNDPNYQNDLFGVATSKASQANQLATADLNNMGYYIDTQGNLAKTGTATSGYNLKNANFNLSQQDAVNKQKALDIENSGSVGEWQRKSELVKAKQYYESLTNPTGTTTDGTTNTDVPTTIMLQNGGKTPTGMFGTDGRLNFTGTTTTPASGLPSNPSNAQQTGQQQVPTGYENKHQHDERIRKENILKSVDTYQKLLDLAIQNGRKDDIAKYSGLLQATKNSLNNPLSNLYDRIFNNQSEADYNYQLNQRKLLGQ